MKLIAFVILWFSMGMPQPLKCQEQRGIELGPAGLPTSAKATTKDEATRPELVLESGHTSGVFAVAFSPDQQLLATASTDNTVKLWDTATGRGVRTLDGAPAGITAVAFSADGRWLAAGCVNGQLHLWEIFSGKTLRNWGAHQGKILNLNFGADGRTLASGGVDQTVKLWDPNSGTELKTLRGHKDWVTALASARNGKLLASGSRDQTVKFWDVITGAETQTLTGHTAPITTLGFADSGLWIASGSTDGAVIVWDVKKRKKRYVLSVGAAKVLALSFGKDGRTLTAVSAQNKPVNFWDISTGAPSPGLSQPGNDDSKGGTGLLQTAVISSDGRWLAASDGSNSERAVVLRNLSGGEERFLSSRVSAVYANAFSRDGKWFASGSRDGIVRLWETTTGRELANLNSDISLITTVAFNQDSRQIAAGGISGSIKIWDVYGAREPFDLLGHPGAGVNAIAFGPDGVLASGGDDGTVKLWDVAARRELKTLTGHAGEVRAVSISPDGHWIASGGTDRTVKLWDIKSGKELRTLAGSEGEVKALAFSPDGRTLAAGNSGKTIKLWPLNTQDEARTLGGHSDWVTALVFTPDSRWIVSGCRDGLIKVWDLGAGSELATLSGHAARVGAISFLPRSPIFSSSSEDGSTIFWDAKTRARLATAVSLRESPEWLVAAPDGSFDGSPGAWGQILWRFEKNTYNVRPVEIFFNEYYYPGLLGDILAGKKQPVQDITRRDRRQPDVRLTLAEVVAPDDAGTSRTATVRLEVAEAAADLQHPKGSGAQDVRLFRNGLLVKVWRGDVLQGGSSKWMIEAPVPLVAGENQFTAYAFNRDKIKSVDANLSVTGAENLRRKGTAYVITVGVNDYANPAFNLNFAVADAVEFGDDLRKAQSTLDWIGRVEHVALLDKQATKDNILLALRRLGGDTSELPAGAAAGLLKLERAQPEDTVIIYYAGHGIAQSSRFYLIPHDLGYQGSRTNIDPRGLRDMLEHSVSDQELEAVLDKIDASQVVMVLDACNSGQVLESDDKRAGPMNSKGLAQLAYDKGMYILAAAQGFQAAKEMTELGHGLLTYALVVQGLKGGAADRRPRDGQVVMSEWFDYATERVPQLQFEKMRGRRGLGLLNQISVVEGEEKLADPNNRSLQRPRVFYRRELAIRPLVVSMIDTGPDRSSK